MKQDPFEAVHLQWFGDPEGVPPITFEDDEDEELDVRLEGEEEDEPEPEAGVDSEAALPESVRGKSKEELAAELERYKSQSDSNVALREAIEGLGKTLARPGQSQAQATQAIKKSLKDDPEFAAKFNKELFGDNPMVVVTELAEKIAEGIVEKKLQSLGGVLQSTVELAKDQIRNSPEDGPLFKKYESEVLAEIDQMDAVNPGVRNNPQVYRYAFNQVKLRHLDDIINERVSAASAGKEKPAAQFSERGGAPAPARKSKSVTVERWEQEMCYRRGLPVDEYARLKAGGMKFNREGDLIE